jgi:nucleoside-diphosphate-sugar epimerase
MKILITGASGFIGSHLAPLLSKDHQVHALGCDLLDFAAVAQEVSTVDPEIVVHLAARTEVEKSFYDPTGFTSVNYTGSVNLIECCANLKNLKNFVFASTMEVYGWQPISDQVRFNGTPDNHVAFDETTLPNPNAPYAVAKLAVEKYLEYMHRAKDFPFTAIRQTNSYGRVDNDFFVTEQIITQMLRDPENIYLGYAEPYRNFIFISDLLEAWQSVINNPELTNSGKIFTLGPDEPYKIKTWASMIADKIDWHGNIHWNSKPKRFGEIYWLNSNHTRITKTLGWKPVVSASEGLDRTIDIWRSKQKIA